MDKEPKKIAPDLTAEQRAAMTPIDLLAQYIVPKLWDRLNMMEWKTQNSFQEIRKELDQLRAQLPPERKPAKRRSNKKEEAPAEPPTLGVETALKEPVVMGRVADYDPDTDKWVPKVIESVAVTGEVVKGVLDDGGVFPSEVIAFVYELSDDDRAVLCELFPE